MQALLQSKRFWLAVAGVVAVVLDTFTGLDVDADTIAIILSSWIVGDSLRPTYRKS